MWEKVLFVLGGVAALYWIYRTVRRSPQAFSSHHMKRSLYTLGWLALALIAFVFLAVQMLKSG